MNRIAAIALFLMLFAGASSAMPGTTGAAAGPTHAASDAEAPLLLRAPALSRTQICFAYGGDLWLVAREGGEARRLTSGEGEETGPAFSPDGSLIAFTGEYEGNRDVYLVPAEGGVPLRMTHHPATDEVAGWTPDGSRILFRSTRASIAPRTYRLFTVGKSGGLPEAVALPSGYQGSYSADGARLAYMPVVPAFLIWKRYRGGETTPIWIADLADAKIEKIPRDGSNDLFPMWIEGSVYFLSDRSGPVSLFAYDTATRRVRHAVATDGFDIKSASAGPGGIVYEQFGSLHLFDVATQRERRVEVRIAADLPQARLHFEPAEDHILAAAVSPTGARAVFEARGEIFTVPAEKGDIRDITATVDAAERDPAWSPDGHTIAYFSDAGGEYALHLKDQNGLGEARRITLGDPPAYYYAPVFSPDGKKVAYLDHRLTLWYVDLSGGRNVKVASDTYETPSRTLDPSWSPDSRFLAYTRLLPNHLHAVCLFALETGKESQVTDGLSDARYAVFDRDGKSLYFTASTDAGPASAWLDMSSFQRPVTRGVYLAVLRRDLPSPLLPPSDEEDSAAGPERKSKKKAKGHGRGDGDDDAPGKGAVDAGGAPVAVRIDFDGLDQRILALPLAPRNFSGLMVVKPGSLLLLETVREPGESTEEATHTHQTVYHFDLESRELKQVVDRISGLGDDADTEDWVSSARLSADGASLLYRRDDAWHIASSTEQPEDDAPALRTAEMQARVDPRVEWRQMFHEVWRIERDFFYDPGHHGLDLNAAETTYAPFLDRLGSRGDLNYLFAEMLGELSVGHLFVNGGDLPHPDQPTAGLLGADYAIESGRYRFARIYSGENWNPELRAPLTGPGVNVQPGDYLLAVNGRELRGTDEIFALFEGTAGRTVVLRVSPKPSPEGARDVSVIPVDSEDALRHRAWIDDNRRTVDRLTGGRAAYIYLPNTGDEGYESFNRYFFAQLGREAAVIDERFNGGGYVADYMIDILRRTLMSHWTTRHGADFQTPVGLIPGPKAMLINEYAGSGGDALPWYFRQAKIGPLIGKRTWGGLVGIYDYPVLMDGGTVTAPRVAFYNLDGKWDVENHGVDPDQEVELDPALWRAGRDTQLEAAVKSIMDRLPSAPPPPSKRPSYPDYHRKEP